MATAPVPNSSTDAVLPPLPAPAPSPLYDDALEDVFQPVFVAVLGDAISAPNLVRPNWQPEPPQQPAFSTPWMAFGIQVLKGDWSPYIGHDPAAADGFGADALERDEELVLTHSYYGPTSQALASRLQDGLMIEQNRQGLYEHGIVLIEFFDATNAPALIKEKWVKKVVQRVRFKRRIRREYAILTVAAANVSLRNEQYVTEIVVTP